MLVHRSGTEFEDMYWIDIESCEIIARELNQKKKKKISYSKHTKNAIKKYQHILTIHSHPSSGPPSIEDLNCNLKYGYDVGIVCCHNGKIYKYTSNQHINKVYYDLKINACFKKAEEERHYISNVEAQWIVLNELVERFDISVKEVLQMKIYERDDVRRYRIISKLPSKQIEKLAEMVYFLTKRPVRKKSK